MPICKACQRMYNFWSTNGLCAACGADPLVKVPAETVSPGLPRPDRGVPFGAKVSGILIAVLAGVGLAVGVVTTAIALSNGASVPFLVIRTAVLVVLGIVCRLGVGLAGGERAAVYGVGVMLLVQLAACGYMVVEGAIGREPLLFGLACAFALLYLVGLVSGVRHWRAFR